ncbi:hypothetical protein ACKVE0_08695 [Acinetobacter albensis]|jgi:hypothetical protein|uniref:Uncharacterized protein n=1 Tax=Acinetobacter albensis TaxID=1673609 RepID=A0A1C4GWY6_9GAMM|nr:MULTISPECIES: hypothetical protein [Acinetobacter]ALD01225.1 hypothetical protein AMQ28_01925 [Acinetobacter sp. TTH0-4]QPF36896.1 hypothetical protein H0S58_07485 [Acinetobacter sp. TTH0-4]SCC72716.1 hypothetical protein GA0116959_111126 [Acinetobacter albensis]
MIHPQVLVTFYKLTDPNNQKGAWANYDENGNFINITNDCGKELKLLDANRVCIDDEFWVWKIDTK